MLGGTYGRTVVVIAGKGNNGADGRVAARLPAGTPACGCGVVDAAAPWGCASVRRRPGDRRACTATGFHGSWQPPDVGDAPVLVRWTCPSGVDALTGQVEGQVLAATRTVTFAALKPGLLVSPGSDLAGEVEVADIGLDVSSAHAHLWSRPAGCAAAGRPTCARPTVSHKWQQAVRVIAGSPTMTGAAILAAHAAMRAGAGMVTLSVPGQLAERAPLEVVQRGIPRIDWSQAALDSMERFKSVVVGPGLGRDDGTAVEARRFVVASPLPTVVDGDALFALAWSAEGAAALLRQRQAPTVLTPHDGEYKLLTGHAPPADRLVAARRLAADTGCTVLLKGPATVVAEPHGRTLVVRPRATAAWPRREPATSWPGSSAHCWPAVCRRPTPPRPARGCTARRRVAVIASASSPATCPISSRSCSNGFSRRVTGWRSPVTGAARALGGWAWAEIDLAAIDDNVRAMQPRPRRVRCGRWSRPTGTGTAPSRWPRTALRRRCRRVVRGVGPGGRRAA